MAQETITGIIDGIIFRNEDTGYVVFRVRIDDHKSASKLVGQSMAVQGQRFSATGEWVKFPPTKWDPFGSMQFKAENIIATMPETEEGLAKYLSSGIIKGIGATIAERIVHRFGMKTIEVIENEPIKLRSLQGLGPKTVEKITAGWAEHNATNRIMVFLHSNGVSTSQAMRIYKTYGKDAIPRIIENPYCLARDIRGIGFKNADKIALNLGVPRDSLQRARAAIGYIMEENSTKGHCGMLADELVSTASANLGITVGVVEEALRRELAVQERPNIRMINDGGREYIYLNKLANYEEFIAIKLKGLANLNPPWKIPVGQQLEDIIDKAEQFSGIKLAAQQRNAVKTGLTSRVMVLTGGPGTGKTSVIKCLLAAYRHIGVRYILAAPTGKAARRMKESTGSDASTLHRLFKLGQDDDHSDVGLVTDVVIIDESSMMDVPLKYAVLDSIPPSASLVIVGDIDQLPSVGPGSVLKDIIDSGIIPTVRLTEIFRQAKGSLIIENAHRVNNGNMPQKGDRNGDFFFLPLSEADVIALPGRDKNMPVEPGEIAEMAVEIVVDLVKRRLPAKYGFDPKKDIQVLCPMNEGIAGANNINLLLQKALNPHGDVFAERMGVKYSPGDRVMQIVNNYEKLVFNGDTGVIVSVDKDNKEVVIQYDGVNVCYDFTDLDEIRLAYAMTIHKSQGSQFPVVVIPLLNQHYMMLARNLLYTGITRASKMVVLVGQESAVRRSVQNDKITKRITRLRTLLTS